MSELRKILNALYHNSLYGSDTIDQAEKAIEQAILALIPEKKRLYKGEEAEIYTNYGEDKGYNEAIDEMHRIMSEPLHKRQQLEEGR